VDQAQSWLGIGLRDAHLATWLDSPPALGFTEVHAENFFTPHGGALHWLQQVRQNHDVSLHAVGLGLGSAVGLDAEHLLQLRQLARHIHPIRVSDHACFCRAPVSQLPAGLNLHGADLLPVAFTDATWQLMATHIQQVQDALQRPLLLENLSAYLRHADDAWEETDFLVQLCARTGCQLLVDMNNIVVNALNWSCHQGTAEQREIQAALLACAWLDRIPAQYVGQIHLAGHREPRPYSIVIDDHSQAVNPSVWTAYQHSLQRWGPRPTLIEWDVDLPPFETLLAQTKQAAAMLHAHQIAQQTAV